MEREDVKDGLDELEQVALRAPAPHTEREIHALRDELGKATVLPFESAGWSDLAPLFEAFLGLFTPEENTRRAFEHARTALRAQIDVAFSVLGPESAAMIKTVAAERLARAPECGTRPSLDGMRRLAPPPERQWVCAAVGVGAREGSDVDEITALVVLHDLVTIGLWAVDLHADRREPARAQAAHPLASRLDDDRAERLVRDAATHPIGPIGGATAVAMLLVDGPAKLQAHARAWSDFGDAPLDVVNRRVFEGRFARKPSQLRASAQQRNPVE
jgi:hypothetical protein